MDVAKGNRIELHFAKYNLKALEYVLEKLIVHTLFYLPRMLISGILPQVMQYLCLHLYPHPQKQGDGLLWRLDLPQEMMPWTLGIGPGSSLSQDTGAD